MDILVLHTITCSYLSKWNNFCWLISFSSMLEMKKEMSNSAHKQKASPKLQIMFTLLVTQIHPQLKFQNSVQRKHQLQVSSVAFWHFSWCRWDISLIKPVAYIINRVRHNASLSQCQPSSNRNSSPWKATIPWTQFLPFGQNSWHAEIRILRNVLSWNIHFARNLSCISNQKQRKKCCVWSEWN